MTTTHLEQEVTFEGAGRFEPDSLRALPKVKKVAEAPREELDAVYYDTADLRLLSHGITLRRRSGGHDEGWHLKLPAEGGRREVHAPLRAGRSGKIPGELNRRVKAYTRGRPLAPVAHLRTHRRRHLLLDKKGRTLAEAAQDQVDAHILDVERLTSAFDRNVDGVSLSGDTGTSTRLVHWSEVEIEKDRGDDKLMRAAGRWLTSHGWDKSPRPGKLDHALGAALSLPAATAPRPPLKPGSAGECVMRRLSEQLDLLLEIDSAVRADEPDAVHAMRSTTRRLRNLLRGHRRVLDRRRIDPVADELRWLTGVLAGPRDREVFADSLPRQAAALTEPEDAALADRIAAQETVRHEKAHRDAVAHLDRRRYHALLDALEELRTAPPLRPGRARRSAVKHLREVASRDHDRVVRRMADAEKAPEGARRDQALHDARKAVRRARHTAETAVPYVGAKAERYRKRTKALQNVLGVHQDAVMARGELPGLAERAHQQGADTYGYGRLHGEQDRIARRALAELPSTWRKIKKTKLTG